jgi:hypothetical protein
MDLARQRGRTKGIGSQQTRKSSRSAERRVAKTAGFKADPSLRSFVFTLKNPHDFPARKFALKAEQKDLAINCYSSYGPHFYDIRVSDNCNANTDSYASVFGSSYANDTGLDGETFFTGAENF